MIDPVTTSLLRQAQESTRSAAAEVGHLAQDPTADPMVVLAANAMAQAVVMIAGARKIIEDVVEP